MKREVIVYPPVEATDEFFEMLPLITGEFEAYVRGRGYDLYRIRDYGAEDSARHVDWKATARTGDLKVRDTREDERKLRVVFDNPQPGTISQPSYERGVAHSRPPSLGTLLRKRPTYRLRRPATPDRLMFTTSSAMSPSCNPRRMNQFWTI